MSEDIAAQTTTETDTTTAAPSGAVVVSDDAAAVNTQDAQVAQTAQQQGTLASTEPVEKAVVAPADWPDDWRVKVAGEDAKELARLERMGSPADVWKAYRALEAKVSSGQLKSGLKPDATPEEVAAWRKENGLPASPEEYRPSLPNGMVPGEADMPLITGFQKTAHELGLSSEQFNKTLGWYYGMMDQVQAEAVEKDRGFRATAEDALRAEWGSAYRSEVKAVANFMEANAPAGMADILFNSRTPDGNLIGDHPEVLRWLNSLARQINPLASLVPAGTADIGKAGQARYDEIKEIQRTDPNRYWRDQKMQDEFFALAGALEGSRAA